VKTKNVAVSISGHSVYIKTINVPNMSKEQLEESIKWEAEQQIPFDIEDVNIDFQILDNQTAPTRCPFFWCGQKGHDQRLHGGDRRSRLNPHHRGRGLLCIENATT